MPSVADLRVHVKGAPETQRRLRLLAANIRRRVLGNALTEGARNGVTFAKGYLVPRRTGLLKKAMAYKVRQGGKDRGYRVIGADRSFRTRGAIPGTRRDTGHTQGATVELVGKGRKGKVKTAKISIKARNVTSGLILDPSKYAHLVEGGRKVNYPVTARAMMFRLNNKAPARMRKFSQVIFAKKVAAVRGRPFMKPASERLKLTMPWVVEKNLRKVL